MKMKRITPEQYAGLIGLPELGSCERRYTNGMLVLGAVLRHIPPYYGIIGAAMAGSREYRMYAGEMSSEGAAAAFQELDAAMDFILSSEFGSLGFVEESRKNAQAEIPDPLDRYIIAKIAPFIYTRSPSGMPWLRTQDVKLGDMLKVIRARNGISGDHLFWPQESFDAVRHPESKKEAFAAAKSMAAKSQEEIFIIHHTNIGCRRIHRTPFMAEVIGSYRPESDGDPSLRDRNGFREEEARTDEQTD